MSSVAQAEAPLQLVRHGTCRLHIVINEHVYLLRRLGRGAWRLKKQSGDRSGAVYAVERSQGTNTCSCHDFWENQAECKHVRALVAAGLLPGHRRRKGGGQ